MNILDKKNKGFSTLLIVMILGSVALALSLSLATSSVWSIKSSINTKNYNQAKALANACAEVGLETLRENNNFVGTGSVTLNNNSCNYTISNTGGSTRLIVVSGTVSGVVRNLNIITSSFNPLVISSWVEI